MMMEQKCENMMRKNSSIPRDVKSISEKMCKNAAVVFADTPAVLQYLKER